MPRYFFHVHDGHPMPDDTGTELADDGAAWSQAVASCGAMIAEMDGHFDPNEPWRMDVTDNVRTPVFTLTFSAQRHR